MRVITGVAKGSKLIAPKGMTTRPTTDRVKEALFNIINNHLHKATFLDLFAGSGGNGIEALSRGAQKAVFIDESIEAIKVIHENLQRTRLAEKAEVYRNDSLKALEYLQKRKEQFDIIFLDPPYLKGFEVQTLSKIGECRLLAPQGIIIVECSKKDNIPEEINNFLCLRVENYGDTKLMFYTQPDNKGTVEEENS
jgi:16S rRNA (guanine966-N2)-methyltransferase